MSVEHRKVVPEIVSLEQAISKLKMDKQPIFIYRDLVNDSLCVLTLLERKIYLFEIQEEEFHRKG